MHGMNAVNIIKDYNKALGTYQRISALEMDPVQRANIQRKVRHLLGNL